jgi:hypothetical protein
MNSSLTKLILMGLIKVPVAVKIVTTLSFLHVGIAEGHPPLQH